MAGVGNKRFTRRTDKVTEEFMKGCIESSIKKILKEEEEDR